MPRSNVSWLPLIWLLVVGLAVYKLTGRPIPVLDELLRELGRLWR
jgi:hypothetical protein